MLMIMSNLIMTEEGKTANEVPIRAASIFFAFP